ncbi:ABC transporter permease [Candidatus Formimonas warabiya]|uniref:Peptide ABC transporter permease n=1 Tax=Formimonas warabiya TaxID=1761012 RepID=A0A3G1L090_FORW1|nr:FtsX-like permease family protein [Candidatus Formimonas warabiya]ATW28080.1 peptide ABC transporter permease [Candidatus Formimonas warabiya]
MKKLDIRLIRTIRQSKGQFISVAVIVAVALCIYMLFNMCAVNLKNAISNYYDLTNFNDIHVQLVKIPQGAIDALKGIDGIKEVQGRVSIDVPLRVKNADEKVNIRIISLPKDEEKINRLYWLGSHRAQIGNDNVVLLEQFAKARNIKPGDTISPFINGRVHQLTVSGIAASAEFVYLMENEQSLLPAPEKFGVAYVSEEFAQSVSGYQGSYNELLMTVNDPGKIDDIVDSVEKKLDKYGVKRIIKREDQLSNQMLTQEVDGIEKMAKTIPVLFLLVAALIIFIMLSRIVQNDRMGIGVLKALGYGNRSILSHYTKYALAIGILGSIVGIGGGILLSGPMIQVYALYFNIPIMKSEIYYFYMVNAFLLTAIFCMTAGILGARPVLRIMPADSMRPEAPKSGKRIMLEKIDIIWRHLSFSWKMVIRNALRTKGRFAFLVLGLALSYAINTVPLFEAEVFPQMFTVQYGEYQKMDYNIEFNQPLNKRVINEISHLIQASKVEPKLEYPFELKNGWRKKTVSIIGIPRNTSFYKFEDENNREVKLPEKGFFIGEGLAKTLKVNRGDKITIKNFVPGKEDLELKVSGIVKQYLGANAYMDLEAMEELLVDKEMITGVSLASQDDVKEKLKDVKNIGSINSLNDMKNAFLEYMDMMIISTRLYLLFGGLLGFAIIYNSTVISISERSMEFASLRVMGFDKKDVYRLVSKENFLMTGFALLLGVPLGIGMIKGIVNSFSTDMMTFPMMLTPKTFIYAALSTFLFVIIAQLAARKKIYRLNFIDALKSRIS